MVRAVSPSSYSSSMNVENLSEPSFKISNTGVGASNAHGANRRLDFHAAGTSNLASNESKCAFRKNH